ncbi:MAG: RNA polymerase sigma factor [Owenweeksia sp.]|nr:RNA polymerase sigma factor [Owenweeksia sp.]
MGKLLGLPTIEQKLVKQLRRGNPKAQRELYEQVAPQMLSVGRRYTGSRQDAEEVLSNALIKVFNKIDQYKGDGPLTGWVHRIVVHESLNFIKYRKNLFVEVEEEEQDQFSHQNLQDKLNAEHLMTMIGELPLGYRTVFNLCAIEGYTHKEVSEMLGIAENTSKSQLSKARKCLQKNLDQNKILYQEK